jgi:hypothetical protein
MRQFGFGSEREFHRFLCQVKTVCRIDKRRHRPAGNARVGFDEFPAVGVALQFQMARPVSQPMEPDDAFYRRLQPRDMVVYHFVSCYDKPACKGDFLFNNGGDMRLSARCQRFD